MDIDYKEWTVPTKWEDITLKQYEDISRYYGDKDKKFDMRDVIHILCNKTVDEVNELPVDFLDEIMDILAFLQTPPKEREATNKVVVNGETYQINVQNKLKTGEYIASETVMKEDKYNYSAMLAILCRKEGEIYDSKFENEMVEKRIKMFEQVPITDLLGVVAFFLNLLVISETHTQLYTMAREAIDSERQNILDLQRSGGVSKLYTKYVMRKLRKLEKSINTIYPTTSSSSAI